MKQYEVTWSMIYQAESPEDAVTQALGDLDTVIHHPTEGPNYFVVRSDAGMEGVYSADEILGVQK